MCDYPGCVCVSPCSWDQIGQVPTTNDLSKRPMRAVHTDANKSDGVRRGKGGAD